MLIKKIVFIILLFWAPVSFGVLPYIVTSDTADGPVTGWDGSATKGAAISIWGLNFGTAAHTSYITVGGQTLYADESGVAEWGAVTNPTTPTLGNKQLQRITFYLNSSMITSGAAPNTSIKVTTADGASNEIPFHTHTLGTSRILFVDLNAGSDATARTSVSLSSPWQTLGKVRASALEGDKIYIRAGTYVTEDRDDAIMEFYNSEWGNGTEYNNILLTAYPTENVQIGTGADTLQFFFWVDNTETHHSLNYWSVSKLTVNVHNKAFLFYSDVWVAGKGHHEGVKIIGNSLSHSYGGATNGYGFTINMYGDLTQLKIIANYFHDAGGGWEPENISKYCIYLGGGMPAAIGVATSSDYIYISWNEFYNSSGRGIDIYGHKTGDYFDHVYINNNYIHHMGANPLVIGGGDSNDLPDVYYRSIGTAYIYNNIFADANLQIKITDGSYGSGYTVEGGGGNFYFYNNTVYDIAKSTSPTTCVLHFTSPTLADLVNNIIDSESGADCFVTYNGGEVGGEQGSYNIWRGSSGIPAWSTTGDLDDTDPELVDPENGDFAPNVSTDSPAIDSGFDTSAIVTIDLFGITRPQGGAMDRGPIEINGESVVVTGTPTASVSNSNGSSAASNTNGSTVFQ